MLSEEFKIKLYSQILELRALASIARKGVGIEGRDLPANQINGISSYLLANLDEAHFHYEPTKSAFKRLLTIAKKRSTILSYDDLMEDPALDEEFRDILREGRRSPARDQETASSIFSTLDKYKKTRALYAMSKTIIEALKEPKIDVDALTDRVTDTLTQIRSREMTADQVRVIGKDANALSLIDEALNMEDENLYKTGFSEFDEKNGGLPSEGVFIMAATTSGGKSALRMNLMKNLYLLNKISVATVSLEMNAKKETRRLLSALSGIEYWKFVRKILSEEERDQAKLEWRKLHRFGKKHDCRYALLCPTRGLSIQQLLTLMKPYKYQALAIDYISLLDDGGQKDQWKLLSDITRECKIFSQENNCLIVLLAQLDSDDDRIRYSKGILENADNAWVWNYSKQEQRDLHQLPIKQLKARDQELFPFDLRENFGCMQVLNVDEGNDQTPAEKTSRDRTAARKRAAVEIDDPLSDPDVAVE